MDYFYEGFQRLDWGFGNPNKTAAFIALIIVTLWSLGVVWRSLFWASLFLAAGFGVFLIQTVSRGGLVAALVGASVVYMLVRPKWKISQWAGVLTVIVGLSIYSSTIGVASRYGQGVGGEEDRSLTNRWYIYRAVPRMLSDSTNGWGKGNAAEAYQQWYQPKGRNEKYLNLVNSHFTWLVEWNLAQRLMYCSFWGLLFFLSWPVRKRRWWSAVLAIWLTFFVASSFSSVAHVPEIWIIPIISLVCLLIDRVFIFRQIDTKKIMLGTGAGGIAYGLLLTFSTILLDEVPINTNGKYVFVGDKDAEKIIALIGNDKAILGEVVGHRIREYVTENSNVAIYVSENLNQIEQQCDEVYLVGDAIKDVDLSLISNISLLNPSTVPKQTDFSDVNVRILWGDFHSSQAWYGWQYYASQNTNIKVIKIPGEGTYLESWTDYIN